jgi:hypothetical protein
LAAAGVAGAFDVAGAAGAFEVAGVAGLAGALEAAGAAGLAGVVSLLLPQPLKRASPIAKLKQHFIFFIGD